ncbi:MAG TPA: AAA family ATPase [Solirubrobacteraceae bacterium]|nr:AAA family ATPase [Solirubrobacteraceae bacterium]
MASATTNDSTTATRLAWSRPLTITDEVHLSAITESQFTALVFERGIAHTAQAQWATSACSLDEVREYALTSSRSARTQSALLDLEPLFGEDSLALVTLRGENAECRLAAAEHARITAIERWLQDRLPTTRALERTEIPIRFWSCGAHGANSISRTIAVPTFDEIAENYPRAVRERLGRLFGPGFRPAEGGQLILWHGAPGTGKTFALRALGWEWRSWCGLHYVIDPEVFFGQRADYMLDVVLDEDIYPFDDEDESRQERRWRLLVLEDTGELLAADAKERTGQGLSRLLNLVDGIVGQGLRVLVLVTTNEPVRRLHPAVARPGRCAARLQFTPFSDVDAAAWLTEHGVTPGGSASATLAELFARAKGHELQREKPVGFGG